MERTQHFAERCRCFSPAAQGINESAAVVRPDGDVACTVDRVKHADGEGLSHAPQHVLEWHPMRRHSSPPTALGPLEYAALKHESYSPQRHVLDPLQVNSAVDNLAARAVAVLGSASGMVGPGLDFPAAEGLSGVAGDRSAPPTARRRGDESRCRRRGATTVSPGPGSKGT
jgi:hypothetical protein